MDFWRPPGPTTVDRQSCSLIMLPPFLSSFCVVFSNDWISFFRCPYLAPSGEKMRLSDDRKKISYLVIFLFVKPSSIFGVARVATPLEDGWIVDIEPNPAVIIGNPWVAMWDICHHPTSYVQGGKRRLEADEINRWPLSRQDFFHRWELALQRPISRSDLTELGNIRLWMCMQLLSASTSFPKNMQQSSFLEYLSCQGHFRPSNPTLARREPRECHCFEPSHKKVTCRVASFFAAWRRRRLH